MGKAFEPNIPFGTVSAMKLAHGKMDWIEAAHTALVEDGIEGVRIDRLCRALGVTKGSFYHHFKGRDALLSAMADEWGRERARVVMDAARDLADEPLARLIEFIRLVEALDLGRHHQAMRTWGAVDARAATAVREVDRVVLMFNEQCLSAAGLDKDEAAALSKMLLASAVGLVDLGDVITDDDRADLKIWIERLVRERVLAASASR